MVIIIDSQTLAVCVNIGAFKV